MKDHSIVLGATITLNLFLRGDVADLGTSRGVGGEKGKKPWNQEQTNGGLSYKIILQGEKFAIIPLEQVGNAQQPYIVEQLGQTPALKIGSPKT